MAGATAQYACKGCGGQFTARTADRARGWALFCSKACKAKKQVAQGGPSGPGQGYGTGKSKRRYPRHDGISPMKHKTCDTCGAPAINGVYTNDPDHPIEWGCALHHDTTPITAGHGQWE